ncbi:hypothetical protein OQ496_10650 [Acetobacter suratthaniensis]|nr:hypothetical protein [Acetobacter suratthaniensis]
MFRVTEKIAHVKNPLTVIAIFAGTAEVSGTAVLPLLEKDTQQVYVWFIMVFPLLLVVAFFIVLYNKNYVLYAPSDFKDENLFASFKPGSPQLRAQKLNEEAGADRNTEEAAQPSDLISTNGTASEPIRDNHDFISRPSYGQIAAQASLAEDLVITRLASKRRTQFARNVSPAAMPSIMFDAVAKDGNNQVIVEVKYTRKGFTSIGNIDRVKETFTSYYNSLPDVTKRGTLFILAIVCDGDAEANTSRIEVKFSAIISEWNIPIQVRVYRMSELRKTIQ